MTPKQLLIALIVVIVLGVVGWSVSLIPHEPASMQQTATRSPILGGVATTSGNYQYTESTAGYDIGALYPQSVPLPTAAASAEAALTLEQKVADSIAAFKSDVAQMLDAEELARLQSSGRKYTYIMAYSDYAAPGYHSYVYQIYQDTGGAHPNGFYLTYTFDESGTLVTLDSLFKPGARYLDRLSAEAYKGVSAELEKRAGQKPDAQMLDTVRLGTAPTPEALQFFYLDVDNTLHLLFPPYQVAAYAAGSFDIAIPLGNLKDILK